MKYLKLTLALLFVNATHTYACAFHEFPPFGADWYHESIYRILYNNEMRSGFGISYNLAGYSKTFLPEPEFPNEVTKPVLLKEQIAQRNLYYNFRISERWSCMVALTMTDIRAQALADDGPVVLGSSSAGQLSTFLTYNIPLLLKRENKLDIKITGGIQTAKGANNIFYSQIGWLKYQWNKVSPRVIAGNYTNVGTLAVSSVYTRKVLSIYSNSSARFFAFNKEGFKYGSDFNLSLTAGYKIPFRLKSIKIELIGGPFCERGLRDTKKKFCTKDEDTFANGSVFSLSTGALLSFKNINAGFFMFQFLGQENFTEFQLYNKSRNTFFVQVSF